ncbi:MAG: hypothetical protein AB2L11_10985 [Syntrophobacteraceae bacterium]
MSLQERYAAMETKELIKIITIHKDQYTPEAIRAAKAELRSRGETSETIAPILKEAQEEERILDEQLKAIKEKDLSDTQRVLFSIFPGIAFYYLIFTPPNWKKRKLEAELCQYRGLFWYIGISTLIVAVLELLKPTKGFPALYFFSLEVAAFLGLIFAHRRARRKLKDMAQVGTGQAGSSTKITNSATKDYGKTATTC